MSRLRYNQKIRRVELQRRGNTALINLMNDVKKHLDPDYLTTEGLEISNGADQKIAVELVVTRISGRMFLEIDAVRDTEEEEAARKRGEKIIDAHSHGWVYVKVTDT